MQTQPISNFAGTLDGNGHKIIGLGSPLFASVGGASTSVAIIKNIVFENLSANCIVKNVLSAKSVTATNIKITSFAINESNYCQYYGFYKTIGEYESYCPSNVSLDKYYVDDEYATVDCGMIYDIEWANYVYITNSYTKCNSKESAFVSHDKFETNGEWLFRTRTLMKTSISYCSNYGNAKNLTCLSSFKDGSEKQYSVTLTLNDIINYGNMSEALFASNPYVYGSSYYSCFSSYLNYQLPIECTRILNFGKIAKLTSIVGNGYEISKISYSSKYANFNYLFNAGETITSTASDNEIIKSSFYNFTPLTKCTNDGGLIVTSYSQVTTDFFKNTFGLDENKWNLDYINIKETDGLPTIKY